MRQWMTCWLATSFIYCAWLIHLSAKPKPKPKTKTKNGVVTLSNVPPPEKVKTTTRLMLFFTKWTHCKVQLVAVWTSAYVTFFTALIPAEHRLTCVDEECSNVHCVSSVFRTATLRIRNYKKRRKICMCIYIYIYVCVCVCVCARVCHFGKM